MSWFQSFLLFVRLIGCVVEQCPKCEKKPKVKRYRKPPVNCYYVNCKECNISSLTHEKLPDALTDWSELRKSFKAWEVNESQNRP